MRNLATHAGKGAGKFFVFGALLAFIAPYLGVVIGLAPTPEAASGELGRMGNPLLVGVAFAAMGATDALLKPLFKRLFKSPPVAEKSAE